MNNFYCAILHLLVLMQNVLIFSCTVIAVCVLMVTAHRETAKLGNTVRLLVGEID